MRASLFITCYNDTLFPETGRAVVRLLERLGVELDFHPKQTCCGQMHANTGFRGEAFCQAKRFVRMYQETDVVVIPSSSCVAMIRDQYPGLFEELGNEELRRQLATLLPRVFELSEFLVDVPRENRSAQHPREYAGCATRECAAGKPAPAIAPWARPRSCGGTHRAHRCANSRL